MNRDDEAEFLVLTVGLWGCSIFRNFENRENPVFIDICMWILGVAFGRASAAWSPLAAGRLLGATPQPPWCRWGERCGIELGYAQAVWVAGTCRRGPRGRGSGWKYFGASGHARSMGPAAAQAHRNASGLAPWAMQPRATNGAGAWPRMRLLRSQALAKCSSGVPCR